MTATEWFAAGCNYEKGVSIYEQHVRKQHIIRQLRRSSDIRNVKLLHKALREIAAAESGVMNDPVQPKPNPNPTACAAPESKELKKLKARPLSSYPVQLHPVYQLRLSTFLEACSLKIKLNSLKEDETEKAFDIQYRIFELFETNDKCWEILKHYETTGRIMPLTASEDYSKMLPAELFRTRENLYSRVSKRKKTIEKKEQELAKTKEPGRQERLKQTIIDKKEELRQLENDIEAITELFK